MKHYEAQQNILCKGESWLFAYVLLNPNEYDLLNSFWALLPTDHNKIQNLLWHMIALGPLINVLEELTPRVIPRGS